MDGTIEGDEMQKTFIKIGNREYEVYAVVGVGENTRWDRRDTRTVIIEKDFQTVDSLFRDGMEWSVILRDVVQDYRRNEDGTIFYNGDGISEIIDVPTETVTDCSDFNIRGSILVRTDGYCEVMMGKMTDLEEAYEMLYGGL